VRNRGNFNPAIYNIIICNGAYVIKYYQLDIGRCCK